MAPFLPGRTKCAKSGVVRRPSPILDPMFPAANGQKRVVVRCKGCRENIPAAVESVPAWSRYFPVMVFQMRVQEQSRPRERSTDGTGSRSITYRSMGGWRDGGYPDLEQLFAWLKDGRISVPIKNTFRLNEIQKAPREYASSERMGSIVIEVSR